MRERDFIKQNNPKWREFEQLFDSKGSNSEKLNELFVEITDDLAYVRTFYPNRSVKVYLNQISQRVFQRLYRPRSIKRSVLISFWKDELPRALWFARRELLLALILFILSFGIGLLSSAGDDGFSRQILGDSYVDMTIANIEQGDPMAVYKQSGKFEMFFRITFNNLIVAFRAFVSGLLFAIGTIVVLVYNGIMVGTFQHFFYERGFLFDSFLTIWQHGTLEISSIIIAGGAGLTMGRGLLFPGTYNRLQSLRISGRRGFAIMIGLIPVFILAAVIEAYVTRFTDAPTIMRVFVISLSLFFVIFYFGWYPWFRMKNKKHDEIAVAPLPATAEYSFVFDEIKSSGELITDGIRFYRKYFWFFFRRIALFSGIIASVLTALQLLSDMSLPSEYFGLTVLFDNLNFGKFPILFLAHIMVAVPSFTLLLKKFNSERTNAGFDNQIAERGMWRVFFPIILMLIVFFLPTPLDVVGMFLLWPTLLLSIFSIGSAPLESAGMSNVSKLFRADTYVCYSMFTGLLMMGVVYLFLLSSPIMWMYLDVINWNLPLSPFMTKLVFGFISTFISFFAIYNALILLSSAFGFYFYHASESLWAKGLIKQIEEIGTTKRKLI